MGMFGISSPGVSGVSGQGPAGRLGDQVRVHRMGSMSRITITPGMIVLHPWHPRWGPGKVIHIDHPKAFIFFRDNLKQKASTVNMLRTKLRVPEEQDDAVLGRLPEARQVGGDWLLPDDFQEQMAHASANELENMLYRALQQTRMGRLAFRSAEDCLAQLKMAWLEVPRESDTYELAPEAQRATSEVSFGKEDANGWVNLDVKLPHTTAVRKARVGADRTWFVGMTDEFGASIRKLHRALQDELFAAIRAVAADPQPGETPRCRQLAVEVENLWCYRIGDYRILYKPYDDQHVVVLLAFGQRTSRYD